jgi:hypothetical protein
MKENAPWGSSFQGDITSKRAIFWDRKWGIMTDWTHFSHAFPAKWGPNFGYSFYEAACPEMKLLSLLQSSHSLTPWQT